MRYTPRIRQFEEAAAPHLDAAYNLARWITRSPDDADDVMQEAYLRAWNYFDSFRGGDFRAWLLAIVRNSCFTWLKRNRPAEIVLVESDQLENLGGAASEESSPEALVMLLENQQRVTFALERLPVEYREILVLREMEDLAYKEIASILEIPIGTVMSRLARARMRLKAVIEGVDDGA